MLFLHFFIYSHEYLWMKNGKLWWRKALHQWHVKASVGSQSDKREFLSRNVNKNTNGFFSSSPHSSPPFARHSSVQHVLLLPALLCLDCCFYHIQFPPNDASEPKKCVPRIFIAVMLNDNNIAHVTRTWCYYTSEFLFTFEASLVISSISLGSLKRSAGHRR